MKKSITFEQGVQIFFIKKILEKDNLQDLVGDGSVGDRFFAKWSKIVCENPDLQKTVNLPSDFFAKDNKNDHSPDSELTQISSGQVGVTFKIPKKYDVIIKDEKFTERESKLLKNEDLGNLMQIEYSAEVAKFNKMYEPYDIYRDVNTMTAYERFKNSLIYKTLKEEDAPDYDYILKKYMKYLSESDRSDDSTTKP